MKEEDQKTALFWGNLFYPIIYDELEEGQISRYLESLSEKELVFPDGKRRKPSLSALWRKLGAYRQGGFEALARKVRNDRGKPRSVGQEIIDKAVEIKRDQPKRSHTIINHFLEEQYGVTIPKSTLYRHLREAGATQIKLGISKKKVRCRWTRDHTHSLWVGDFEEGPYVLMDGQSYQTYLSAFIDVHSRYVVEGRYYLHQNRAILTDTLVRAWAIHGISRSLYVDNAKVYYSDSLQAACFSLGVKLLHRPPHEPESGGIIEKFFQTVQSQFEAEVRAGDIVDLDYLNQAFSAWLGVNYHQRKHSETGETPEERYNKGLTTVRPVDLDAVVKFFMKKEKRTVHKDFSDISLNGRFYKVDNKFRGDRVEVRYDEFGDMETVLIFSLKGEYLGKGKLHQRERRDEPFQPQSQAKPKYDYLSSLIKKHEEQLRLESHGIDYRPAVRENKWPFLSFITTFAKLMGRQGGSSAFSSDELEALKRIYGKITSVEESMLTRAFENAQHKTIANVTYELQLLAQQGKEEN